MITQADLTVINEDFFFTETESQTLMLLLFDGNISAMVTALSIGNLIACALTLNN